MVKIGRRSETLAGHMAPANLQSEQLHRLVVQALDRVVTEEQRGEILHQALVTTGSHEVPADIGRFARFLFGALRDAVAGVVGEEDADTVVQSLELVVNAQVEAHRENEEMGEPEPDNAEAATALVVDSDIVVRSQLVKMLKAMGYNAVSAPDGNVALAMCVRYKPDLVLSEKKAGTGKQLAALLSVAFGADAPKLVLTVEADEDASELEGAAAAVPKPVSDEALASVVKPLLA
jgi:CheY-like chemotaxis protein